MSRNLRTANAIQFLDDGSVVVQFMDASTDVRNQELLVMSHQLLVRPGDGGAQTAAHTRALALAEQMEPLFEVANSGEWEPVE